MFTRKGKIKNHYKSRKKEKKFKLFYETWKTEIFDMEKSNNLFSVMLKDGNFSYLLPGRVSPVVSILRMAYMK